MKAADFKYRLKQINRKFLPKTKRPKIHEILKTIYKREMCQF